MNCHIHPTIKVGRPPAALNFAVISEIQCSWCSTTLMLMSRAQIYTVAQKIWHSFVRFITSSYLAFLPDLYIALSSANSKLSTLCRPILTNFQTFSTARIERKFAILLSLKIPLHLKYVAALSREMAVS